MVISYYIISAKVEKAVSSLEHAVVKDLGNSPQAAHAKNPSPSAPSPGSANTSTAPANQETQEFTQEESPQDGSHISVSTASQPDTPPIPESEPKTTEQLE
jgi:hypothetical protein